MSDPPPWDPGDLASYLEAGDQRILAILQASEGQNAWLAGYLEYADADAIALLDNRWEAPCESPPFSDGLPGDDEQ